MISDKAVNTAFYVPNDEAGSQFIAQARRFLNRGSHRLRLMGRGPGWNGRGALPLKKAEYFAVYLDAFLREADLAQERNRHYQERADWATTHEVNVLEADRKLREVILEGLRREKEADEVIEKLVKDRDDALVKSWGTIWRDVQILIHRWWLS